MCEKTIYTIGYGNNAPEQFLDRLKAAGITLIIDVRRAAAKGWCASYWQGERIAFWLDNSDIGYFAVSSLGNRFSSLELYQGWLSSSGELGGMSHLEWLADGVSENMKSYQIAILCAELHAYKDGKTNCHRVYVANALMAMLGEGWEVKHL